MWYLCLSEEHVLRACGEISAILYAKLTYTQCRCVTTHTALLQDKDSQKQQKTEASTVQSYNFDGPHRAVVSHTLGKVL